MDKVEQLKPLKTQGDSGVYDYKVERVNVSDTVDEARMRIPKIAVADITAEYDHYATELRKLDTAIQEANWKFAVTYKEASKPKPIKD